jgi:hypothetical protein
VSADKTKGPGTVTPLAIAATRTQDPVAVVECRQMKGPGGTQWVFTILWNDQHTDEEAVKRGLKLWTKNL